MNEETIDYRLKNIEDSIAELKDVVLKNKLQEKDIAEMHEDIKDLQQRVGTLETLPNKDKAQKWSTISDMVFKSVITVIIAIVLAKIGLTK